MITSLKQADIVVGKDVRCHGNHKSKINNRYTKTKKKRTQAYLLNKIFKPRGEAKIKI